MLHFFKLIRWKNLLIILFTQVFVFVFLQEKPELQDIVDFRLFLLVFSTFLLAAAGYLINDYSDIKIDVINKPENLIVGKYISARWVLLLHFLFNIIGIGIGFYLNYTLGIINLITAWLLWRYSISLKYKLFTGNIVVAGLMALSLIVVCLPFNDMLFHWLIFYSCFAFLTGLAREIIKDVEDMEGDATYGCRTVPIVYGIFRTKILLQYITIGMIILLFGIIIYFLFWKVILFPIYLGLFVLLPLVQILFLLRRADTKKLFRVLSTRMKIVMMLGILSMALRLFL